MHACIHARPAPLLLLLLLLLIIVIIMIIILRNPNKRPTTNDQRPTRLLREEVGARDEVLRGRHDGLAVARRHEVGLDAHQLGGLFFGCFFLGGGNGMNGSARRPGLGGPGFEQMEWMMGLSGVGLSMRVRYPFLPQITLVLPPPNPHGGPTNFMLALPTRLRAGLLRLGQVEVHLVPVEVGVVGRADALVEAEGAPGHHLRGERESERGRQVCMTWCVKMVARPGGSHLAS